MLIIFEMHNKKKKIQNFDFFSKEFKVFVTKDLFKLTQLIDRIQR